MGDLPEKKKPKSARLFMAAAALFAVCGIMALLAGPPVLVLGQNHDQGTVTKGAVVRSDTYLINLSTSRVTARVLTMCECTTTTVGAIPLRPFACVRLPLRISTANAHEGAEDKGAVVYFDSPQGSWQTLISVKFRVAGPEKNVRSARL